MLRQQRNRALTGLLLILALSILGLLVILTIGHQGFDTLLAILKDMQSNRIALLTSFTVASVLSQLLILPNGTLLLLLGGFLLGAVNATLIYTGAQVLMAPWVFQLAESGFGQRYQHHLHTYLQRLPDTYRKLLHSLQKEDLLASAVLRMAPIIPSAIACLLAASFGLSLKAFFLGTLLTAWIRPLFFSGLGEAVHSLLDLQEPSHLLLQADMTPIILTFCSAGLLLGIRIWIRLRT